LTSQWYYLDPDAKEFFQEETEIGDDEKLKRPDCIIGVYREIVLSSIFGWRFVT